MAPPGQDITVKQVGFRAGLLQRRRYGRGSRVANPAPGEEMGTDPGETLLTPKGLRRRRAERGTSFPRSWRGPPELGGGERREVGWGRGWKGKGR